MPAPPSVLADPPSARTILLAPSQRTARTDVAHSRGRGPQWRAGARAQRVHPAVVRDLDDCRGAVERHHSRVRIAGGGRDRDLVRPEAGLDGGGDAAVTPTMTARKMICKYGISTLTLHAGVLEQRRRNGRWKAPGGSWNASHAHDGSGYSSRATHR